MPQEVVSMKKDVKKIPKKAKTTKKCQENAYDKKKQQVSVVGRLMEIVIVFTPNKMEKMAMVYVGSDHDYIRVVLMPSVYRSVSHILRQGNLICISGERTMDKDEPIVIGNKVFNFDTKELEELISTTPEYAPVVYDGDYFLKLKDLETKK